MPKPIGVPGSVCLAVVIAFDLTVASAASNSSWSLRTWQSDEGLPDNAVVGIGQTRDGFLWVATQGGLVRFDGLQFHDFDPLTAAGTPTGLMRALCVDQRDRLWVAKDLTALAWMDQDKILALTTQDGLPTGRAKTIVADRANDIWVAYSGKQVARIRNGQIRVFTDNDGLPATAELQLACDQQGNLWYACNQGAGIFRGERFTSVTSLPSTHCLGAAYGGGMWLCAGHALYRCDEKGKTEKIADLPRERNPLTPTMLHEDRSGAVWIGTSNSGLWRYSGPSQFVRVATSHREILCLTEDREGNLWVGTMGGGLNRLRPAILELVAAGSPNSSAGLRSLCEDAAGTLWAVDRNGVVSCGDGDGWRPPAIKNAAAIQGATAVAAAPDGGVWVGLRTNTLCFYRSNELVRTWRGENGLMGNVIRTLLTTPNGDLWIGTIPTGLQRLREGKFQTFALPPEAGPVRTMAADSSGTVWAGTASGMLFRVSLDELIHEELARSSTPQAIRCLFGGPDGALWIGYAGTGLGRLKNGRFTQFRANQGLYDDYVSAIIEDAKGRLWMAGNRGIFFINRHEFDAVAAGQVSQLHSMVFGRDEGLGPLQASWDFWPSATRARDGRLCIAMQTGLAIIHPEAVEKEPAPPPVIIEKVLVDDKEVASGYDADVLEQAGDRDGRAPSILDLRHQAGPLKAPPEHERVTFIFTSPSFAMPNNLLFRYRLEPFDKNWVDAGTQRAAYYTHIPPGKYKFRVAASNRSGNWVESAQPLDFVSQPGLWETGWFRAGLIITVTGLLTGGVLLAARARYRRKLGALEQEQALERERARIAQDLHDDLGAGLVEISFGSQLAQDPGLGPDEMREHSREIGERAREMVSALDEIVWAVNPRHDSLSSLASYFCQYAQHFLKTTAVRCQLEIARDLPAVPLNSEERHQLFLAFKQALCNVVQHSGATQVRLRIDVQGQTLLIALSDNGRGLNLAKPANGADGIDNMKNRLQRLGGICKVSGNEETGASVEFEIPLSRLTHHAPQ